MPGMTISELARRSGVPASTLRYYDALGLVRAERMPNGYRVYAAASVDRLQLIARARALALPLADIRDLIGGSESEPCSQVKATSRSVLLEQRAKVHRRIADLEELRNAVDRATARLDALPDRATPCDADCLRVADEPSPPVACTLGPAGAQAERIAAWRRLLRGATAERVPSGRRVTLPIGQLAATAALAAAEQRCCPFFGFRFDLYGGAFDLTITAPLEAADVLDALLPTPT